MSQEIYNPYVLRNGLYITSSLEDRLVPSTPAPTAPKMSRQQARAQQRRMKKQIKSGLKRGMLQVPGLRTSA